MDSDELDHIRELLYGYRPRLRGLEVKQALQGINTPVEFLIEIEDLEQKIQRCQSQIDSFQKIESVPPQLYSLQVDGASDTSRNQIEITFNGSFEDLTPEIQNAVIRAIAGIVEISPNQVRVLRITAGSVIVLVELPTEAANTILKLYEAGDDVIKELDIQEVKVVSEKVVATSKLGENAVINESALLEISVDDLARKCAQEADLYFAHQDYDSRYCFELFRRAIQDQDKRALDAVIIQYQPLVARWVYRMLDKHPDLAFFDEESEDFVAKAFERFWNSFTPAKLENSQNLAAVLRYLQMCVTGAITDSWRQLQRVQIEEESQDEKQEFSESEPSLEDLIKNHEFWQLIGKKARDPKEYRVAYASFFLNLSPSEILSQYPGEFDDIKEVNQLKVNFLARLNRDTEIRDFIQKKNDTDK